ncbi:MAG: hypothetical protein CM1200mP29_07340 [Verrucomicrobiota bacterium]|nr:MAG: hypothetical protein CM1200mP29_07340 [Verrucomicrobiota bacterium]
MTSGPILAPEMARHINIGSQPKTAAHNRAAAPKTGDWWRKCRCCATSPRPGTACWADLQVTFKLPATAALQIDATPGLLGVEAEGSPTKPGRWLGRTVFPRPPMQLSCAWPRAGSGPGGRTTPGRMPWALHA